METETLQAFTFVGCSMLSSLALSWGAGVLISGWAPQRALVPFRSVREYGWHSIGVGVSLGLFAVAAGFGGRLTLLLLPAMVLPAWLSVRLRGRQPAAFLLRLDRATAADLATLLDDAGEHLATGRPIMPRSTEERVRLGRVLHDLRRKLGPTPLGHGKGRTDHDVWKDRVDSGN